MEAQVDCSQDETVTVKFCQRCSKGVLLVSFGPGRKIQWTESAQWELPAGLPLLQCSACNGIDIDEKEMRYLIDCYCGAI